MVFMRAECVALQPKPVEPTMPVEPIHLPPEVDYAAADAVRRLLDPALFPAQCTVVVDFSGVAMMDCVGLGILLAANAAVGGRMRLVGCPPFVSEFLLVTDTSDAFDVVSTSRVAAQFQRYAHLAG